MNYASILWGSVLTGVGFFAIYIAYLVIVKGRLRGININRELYSAVGAFTAFIIMMSIITPLLGHLPSLTQPPPGGLVFKQYDIVTAVLGIVKMVAAIILFPVEEFDTYYSLSNIIDGIVGFIGGLAYLTAMVIALYKALLALFPFAPLFISLALARPNKPGSIVLMGIGLMALVATPLIGWVASLFYKITMGVVAVLTPPCLDIKILGVAYYGPSPALVTTSQGVFMTNGTRYIPIWGCEGVYVTQVAWDWLVLNSYYILPPGFSIIPLYGGILMINAQLPFPATAIENSSGVYGAWFPLRVLRYWRNGTGYMINDTVFYIRNESVLFWAWADGVGGNCSLKINETGMVKTTLVSGPMVLPMFAPLTGSYPPGYYYGYRQMLINATAFNESCIIIFEPGSRWSGYTVLPATGPVEWALAGPLNLVIGLNSQWNNVETAFTTVGVLTAAVTLLGILLLPYLAIGTAYLGAIIVEFISPLWGVISQLLPF
ncbi:hypothetical protein [Caldivirga sp. MU80]|uniref:hypothetical protein n=1 Tax=Caldivirga sp. MU80 TaxID=1650354 RepID=UPI00082D854F|nr:hypothetical protein [Caldivirga sp. MU80]